MEINFHEIEGNSRRFDVNFDNGFLGQVLAEIVEIDDSSKKILLFQGLPIDPNKRVWGKANAVVEDLSLPEFVKHAEIASGVIFSS